MTPQSSNLPELMVEFFNRAAEDAELSERMSFANTVVHMHFTDLVGENACTVSLDRDPISAELGAVGSGEVELFGTAQVYQDLFLGSDQLPIAILNGKISYTGPVRKFLRVVPILQSFDFDMFRGLASAPAVSAAPRDPAA